MESKIRFLVALFARKTLNSDWVWAYWRYWNKNGKKDKISFKFI